MSITINVAAAKKLPHPTQQYGSIQATVSLSGECGTLADAPAVMRDLLMAAQGGVEEHLAQQTGSAPPLQVTQPRGPMSTTSNGYNRSAAAPPSGRPAPRRGLPGATESQIRLLRRLLGNDDIQIAAFCHDQGIASLEAADLKRASAWIDTLKSQGTTP